MSIRSLHERSACQDFNGGVPEERFRFRQLSPRRLAQPSTAAFLT
jgi:hypothetical protein